MKKQTTVLKKTKKKTFLYIVFCSLTLFRNDFYTSVNLFLQTAHSKKTSYSLVSNTNYLYKLTHLRNVFHVDNIFAILTYVSQ